MWYDSNVSQYGLLPHISLLNYLLPIHVNILPIPCFNVTAKLLVSVYWLKAPQWCAWRILTKQLKKKVYYYVSRYLCCSWPMHPSIYVSKYLCFSGPTFVWWGWVGGWVHPCFPVPFLLCCCFLHILSIHIAFSKVTNGQTIMFCSTHVYQYLGFLWPMFLSI